jgi:predicted RNase H-like HicB family nuclease
MTLHYEGIIYWSSEDQSLIAEARELPGCMADGKAHGEALSNLDLVMAEWIETARELGWPDRVSLHPPARRSPSPRRPRQRDGLPKALQAAWLRRGAD